MASLRQRARASSSVGVLAVLAAAFLIVAVVAVVATNEHGGGGADARCAALWTEARATLDGYALVMDLGVRADRNRYRTLRPRWDALLRALQEGACTPSGTTAAHALLPGAIRAVHRAHAHITKDLLATGRAGTVTRATVHDAAGAWMYDLVERLLADDAGATVPLGLVHDGDGLTPVHLAVLFREPWLLRRFLSAPLPGAAAALASGASGAYGMTPLHLAAVNGDVDAVRALLDAGAPLSAVDAYGRTPLELALATGYADVATDLSTRTDATNGCSDRAPCCWTPGARRGAARRLAAGRPGPPGCPFDRVAAAALDANTFERDYLSLRRPVIIEDAMGAWAVRDAWRADRLRDRFSQQTVRAGSIPYASVFGEDEGHSTLGAFLDYLRHPSHRAAAAAIAVDTPAPADAAPAYLFDSSVLVANLEFFDPARNPLPAALAPLTGAGYPLVWQFFYGPPRSGAPYHFHCDAVNALVRGGKRWLLLPPGASFYAKAHPAQSESWFGFGGDDARPEPGVLGGGPAVGDASPLPYRCRQAAGDLVFVPGFWGHATLNEDEAIGFAVEFDRGDC